MNVKKLLELKELVKNEPLPVPTQPGPAYVQMSMQWDLITLFKEGRLVLICQKM